jgi:hypothetical protein
MGSIHTVTSIGEGYNGVPLIFVNDCDAMFATRFELVTPTLRHVTEDVLPAIFAAIECADNVTQAHDKGSLNPTPNDSVRIDALKTAITALHKLLTENSITKD